MSKYLFTAGVLGLVLSFATSANASLQGVLDGITVSPNPGDSSINAATDFLTDGADDYWSISATGGSVATIIIELAGNAAFNTFGVYDAANSANSVQIFSGAASTGSQALLSILADGSVFVNFVDTGIDFAGNVFGYYLDGPGGLFFSDTNLNADNFDHMRAYQGNNVDVVQIPPFAAGTFTDNEYILAWEDLNGGGDQDYDDFVVMVESVQPIPEAMSLLIWAGLFSIGACGVFRRQRSA